MKNSKLTDSQIMEALKRVEAGLSVPELAGSWASVLPPFTSDAPSLVESICP